jgi:integrase
MTLAAYLRSYLGGMHDLRPKSALTYRQHIQRLELQFPDGWCLGAIRLRDLTEQHCLTWYALALDRSPLHGRTVRDTLGFARQGLSEAVRRGVLLHNPFEKLRTSRPKRPLRNVLRAPELRELRRVADPRTRLLLVLAAQTGARRGELLALRWQDVDLRAKTITINASLDWTDGEPVLQRPKTEAGRRTVSLTREALTHLHAARLEANTHAVHSQRPVAELPVIRNDDRADGWYSPAAASQAARRALASVSLRGSLHGLRHAHATALLASGRPAHQVRDRLGHHNVAVTLGLYAHAMPSDDRGLTDALDRIMDETDHSIVSG